jgi:hypothetical protein
VYWGCVHQASITLPDLFELAGDGGGAHGVDLIIQVVTLQLQPRDVAP